MLEIQSTPHVIMCNAYMCCFISHTFIVVCVLYLLPFNIPRTHTRTHTHTHAHTQTHTHIYQVSHTYIVAGWSTTTRRWWE